jgi:PAS domain S-box-containing protein
MDQGSIGIRPEEQVKLLLRENELLNNIIQSAADSIYAKDLSGRYVTINAAGAEALNWSVNDIIGRTDEEILGEHGTFAMRKDAEVFETGKSVTYESRAFGGLSNTYFRTSKAPLYDNAGNIIGLIGISRDVTAARLAEEKYQFIFDNAPIAFWEEDFSKVKLYFDELRKQGVKDFRKHFSKHPEDVERCIELIEVKNVNRTTLKMNGVIDKPSLISKIQRNFTPDSEKIFLEEFIALAEGRTYLQAEGAFVNFNGTMLEVQFNLNVLPGHEEDLSLVLISVVDITEYKQLTRELNTFRHRYQSIVDAQTEMICRINASGRVILRNPSFSRFFDFKGLDDETRFVLLFPPEELEKCEQKLAQLTATEPSVRFELRNYDKDGNLVWQQWSITAFYSNSGMLLGYQAVGSDVTERRMTQDALAASEARWRTVFEHADDMIMTINSEGYILSVNDFKELRGMKWAGKRLDEVMTPENAKSAITLISKVFASGTPLKTEYRFVTKSGNSWYYDCVVSPILHGNRVITAIIIARNITDTKEVEKQMREALIEGQENERMRVSQELHDGLGQLFTAIKLNLQYLKSGLGADVETRVSDRLKALEDNIGVAITEVKNISRNLMPDVLWQFGLRPAIEDMVAKWNETAHLTITLEMVDMNKRFSPELEKTVFRMCQELLNNAIRHGQSKQIFLQVINHDDSLVVMSEDDGNGFDPRSVLSGFGLRNIRSRAELIGGTVEIDSAPGEGTVITIEIPLNDNLKK